MFANKELSAKFSLLLVSLIWASTFAITKNLLDVIDPISLIFWRFFIASVLLGGALLIMKEHIFKHFRYGFITGVLLFLVFICQNIGLQYTTSNNSSFILGLTVIWTPFVSLLFGKDSLTRTKILVTLGIIPGIWLITGGLNGLNSGDLITLFGSIIYAFYLTFVALWSNKVHSLVLTFQQFLVTTVFSILSVLMLGLPLLPWGGIQSWGPILYLGIFPSLIAFNLLTRAGKYLTASITILILSSRLAIGPLFAWSIEGEVLTIPQSIGGLIIIAMVIIANLADSKKHDPKYYKAPELLRKKVAKIK
jgi:drug/metabolite transporter (DMT)-like permease